MFTSITQSKRSPSRRGFANPAAAFAAVFFITLFSHVIAVQAMPARPVAFDRSGEPVDAGEGLEELMASDDIAPGICGPFTDRTLPVTGNVPLPVLLVQYLGQAGQQNTAAFFNILFPATGGTTTANDYYREVSLNQVSLTGTVNGWYTLPRPKGWYINGGGGMLNTYPLNSQGLVQDAVMAADSQVDFSQYDGDGDGFVDALLVYVCGYAAESYVPANPANELWSHCYWMRGGNGPGPISVDGVQIDLYAITTELRGTAGNQIRDIGVVCHELGHCWGLCDLYSTCPGAWQTFYGSWNGLGTYDLMAFGGWGAGGTNPDMPHHLSAFGKAFLGWANINYVDVDIPGCAIQAVETSGDVFTNFPWWTSGGADLNYYHPWFNWPGPTEAFLVENRQQIGFDAGLPGRGLLIYHFDGTVAFGDYDGDGIPNWHSNALEWSEVQPMLDVECADQILGDHVMNSDDLDAQINIGDAGDFFHAGGNANFDAASTPSNVYHTGLASQFAVNNISAISGTMFADITVGNPGGPNHDVWIRDCTMDDGSVPSTGNCDFFGYHHLYDSPDIWVDNNEDGIVDVPVWGSTNKLFVKVRNLGPQSVARATVKAYDTSQGLAPPQPPPSDPANPFAASMWLGTKTVLCLAPGDSAIVEFPWYLSAYYGPPTWPNSAGALVETSDDPLGGSGAVDLDNNLAMCTGKWLYIKSGSPLRESSGRESKLAALRGEIGGGAGPCDREDMAPALQIIPVNNPYEEERMMAVHVEGDLPPGWFYELFSPEFGIVPLPFFFPLAGLEVHEFELTVIPSPEAAHGDTGEIAVIQCLAEYFPYEVMGSIVMPVGVDLLEPMPVTALGATIIEPEPCIPGLSGVALEWEPSRFDVSGTLSSPSYYAVYRDTQPAVPLSEETCVGYAAVDAIEETETWEWLDRDAPLETDGTRYYYCLIAVDEAGNESEPSAVASTDPQLDYADHDDGAARLTVTDRGILGYMEMSGRGSGFQYPQDGQSHLFVGSFMAGISSEYVASVEFESDPAKQWQVSDDPDGHVLHGYGSDPPDWMPELADHEGVICTGYRDTGTPDSQGWLVGQASLSFAAAPDDKYVILGYRLSNESDQTASDLYLGEYLDLDIIDPGENWGATDPGRRLVYMWLEGGPYVGLALLSNSPQSNLTLVHNPTSIYPDAYLPETEKYAFLSAQDPEHQIPEAWQADDWSVMASAGPYNLPAGGNVEVVFAMVAGDDLADLQASTDAALAMYLSIVTDVVAEEDPVLPARLVLAQNVPNPFNPKTEIRYNLPAAGQVAVEIFDLQGRRVETLFSGVQEQGEHRLEWVAESQASGIYFLRVKTDDEVRVGKMALIK